VLVYRLEDSFGLVVNAGNRLKLLPWIAAHQSKFDCDVSDHTTGAVMLAVQGPQVLSLLQPLTTTHLASIKYYFGAMTELDGVPVSLSRTGYTGEDGVELVLDAAAARTLADKLLTLGVKPCGLGCRDTLRLEAAMPLYGHELTESIDPLTAGLQFAVKLDKPDFIGKGALVEIAKRTDRPVRVGLQLAGRRIAREGAAVFTGDNRIGEVTSGTFSPTLEKAIAMAYVAPGSSSIETAVEVDIRGKRESATVVKLPFYQRAK
jgi:aminomethyltransferase